jgi:LysM repeat protein
MEVLLSSLKIRFQLSNKGDYEMKTSPKFMRTGKYVKIITFILMLSLFANGLPSGIAVASVLSDATCSQKYTVQSGDTLIKIATQYKVNWLDIAKINNLKAPYTIYIGQILCIPTTGASIVGKNTNGGITTTSRGKAPDFSATRIDRNKLIIQTANFPQNSFYYVKVRSGSGVLSDHWTKISMLRTRKDSSASYIFNLPNEFRKHSTVVVCLKNAVTDGVICRSARR